MSVFNFIYPFTQCYDLFLGLNVKARDKGYLYIILFLIMLIKFKFIN